jgi:hypothetical protein
LRNAFVAVEEIDVKVIEIATGLMWIALLSCIPVFGWALALYYTWHWMTGGFDE